VRGANRNLRSSIPPLAASFDTLRQFNEVGKTPRFRVVPLPIATTTGGGSVVNITNSTSTGGGSSTTTGTTTLSPASVVITTPSIAGGGSALLTATMARSFQLLSVTANAMCCVRLYGSSVSQSIDSLRGIDSPVPAEVGQDIITDVVLDTAPYQWNWQDRVGANSSSPQTMTIYVTVLNPLALSEVVTLTIKYLPLQTTS
jgi:hypothetical protein